MAVHVTLASMPARQPTAFPGKYVRSVRVRARIYEGAQLKAALEDQAIPVLYTHVLCPYAQRAWLALLEKGVDFSLVNVDLSSKPRWYSELNPAGLVPAVAYLGQVQTESLDILSWVDETLTGRKLVLEGKRRATQQLLTDCSRFVSAGLRLLAGSTGRSWGIGTGQTESQKREFVRQLQQVAERIGESGGPFLTGGQPSLADIAYFPFVERFAIGLGEFCGLDLADAGGESVRRWLEAMQQLESVQISSADPQLLLEAFRQHRSLDFFDYQTFTATQLHPHLCHEVASA